MKIRKPVIESKKKKKKKKEYVGRVDVATTHNHLLLHLYSPKSFPYKAFTAIQATVHPIKICNYDPPIPPLYPFTMYFDK